MANTIKFFQNEKKFVVGKLYETIRVKSPPYSSNYVFDIETCDERGTIIPNSELFLGKYVNSQRYGYGDNSGRCDQFINNEGQQVSHYLDYDGTTRYREVRTHMDERVAFLKVVESTGEIKNENNEKEHINKFILNDVIVKEVCSFMNPLVKE